MGPFLQNACLPFVRSYNVTMDSNLSPVTLDRPGYSVRGLANWILDLADELGAPVTNMALNKLLFFAVEAIVLERGTLITNAKIEAWEHGPVFREIYQAFKAFGDRPITSRASFFSPASGRVEVSQAAVNPSHTDLLRAELVPLIRLSAARLRYLSHVENGAWHRAWWYQGHANPGMEITPEILATSKRSGRRL